MFKKAVKLALPGVGFAIVMSALLGYFVFPVPANAVENAFSSAMGGAINAFLASMFALIGYMKKNG